MRVPFVEAAVVTERVEKDLMMRPADLCRQCLHLLRVCPQSREPAHVEQVSAREAALLLREPGSQIGTQAIDHRRSPALALLPFEDVAADRPVEADEQRVHHPPGLELGGSDPLAELIKKLRVGGGRLRVLSGGRFGTHGRIMLTARAARQVRGRGHPPSASLSMWPG